MLEGKRYMILKLQCSHNVLKKYIKNILLIQDKVINENNTNTIQLYKHCKIIVSFFFRLKKIPLAWKLTKNVLPST